MIILISSKLFEGFFDHKSIHISLSKSLAKLTSKTHLLTILSNNQRTLLG